jgi:hypothetical protein
MHMELFDDCEVSIRGLRLPANAWRALEREKITTLTQLNAIADSAEWIAGVGQHRPCDQDRA